MYPKSNQTGYSFQGAAKNKQIILFEGLYPQHAPPASMIHTCIYY